MRRTTAALSVLLAVSLLVNGYLLLDRNGDGEQAPSVADQGAAETAKTGTGATGGMAAPTPAAPGKDGSGLVRKLAYVRGQEGTGDDRYLEIDEVERFAGEEAERAAREDGNPEAGSLANGFYIRDIPDGTSRVRLDPEASIYVYDGNAVRLESYEAFTGGDYRDRLFRLSLADGKLILLEEQYMP